MCEPNHSINQYPDDPDQTPKIEAAYNQASLIARVKNFAKKIGNWLNFSMMGKGHSEQLAARQLTMYRVAEPTRYEAQWWNRGFHRDGSFVYNGISPWTNDPVALDLMQDAYEAAKIYADRTSIGNLSIWRRFFEASIKSTDYPWGYFHHFLNGMLNTKGRDAISSKIRAIHGPSVDVTSVGPTELTKICLGFSRKRELLVPEWADDTKIWQPGMA